MKTKTILSCAFALLAIHARAAEPVDPHFEVNCSFVTEERAPVCIAEIRLCATGASPDCRDQGFLDCAAEGAPARFDGEFSREVAGNRVLLKGISMNGTTAPLVNLGPAKAPPKPGRPVISDSLLEFGALQASGECSVKLIR